MSVSNENSSVDNKEKLDGDKIANSSEDGADFKDLEEDKIEVKSQSTLISQRELIAIIFSKKTLYHVLILFFLLAFFGIISYTKSDLASSLILIFGYGSSLGYFLTAALNRFEEVKNLSRSKSLTSLVLLRLFL